MITEEKSTGILVSNPDPPPKRKGGLGSRLVYIWKVEEGLSSRLQVYKLMLFTPSSQTGRKLVYRSEPPVLKRKQKEKDEMKQKEEEELQYFFS